MSEVVEPGTTVCTDAIPSYRRLRDAYVHKVIDHAVSYVEGVVHTNGIENFWSLLKRTLNGTYISVREWHLFRYLDEQAFRFNERKGNDYIRFCKTVWGTMGRRVEYAALIGGAN